MNYTVVGMFPNAEMANDASRKLVDAGFPETDHNVSTYRTEGDYAGDDYDYEEDEDTRSFWDKLFGTEEDKYERKAYSYAGSRSNMVTVYTEEKSRAEEASRIMDEAGAISVDDHLPETFYNQYPEYKERASQRVAEVNAADNIQVVKEEMNVGKKEVETGGVKIRSRVIEKPVEESVRLRKERVYVKRQPVNRVVTDADAAFQNTSVEMTQSKEVPVVDKTARVVEEISVEKDVHNVDQVVTGTVRETEVDIEDTTTNRDITKDRI